jgi:hypothetical protein
MRVVYIRSHGGPGVVSVAELPASEPGPSEVRVAVRAAAVNLSLATITEKPQYCENTLRSGRAEKDLRLDQRLPEAFVHSNR